MRLAGILVVGSAAALGRDHAGAHGLKRCTDLAKERAVPGGNAATQNLAAATAGYGPCFLKINTKAQPGVHVRIFLSDLQATLGDFANAAPECVAGFEHSGHKFLCPGVAIFWYCALVGIAHPGLFLCKILGQKAEGKEDVRWLGADWKDKLFFASDYFEKFYEYAVQLIKLGKAYVCELSDTEMREYRGTLTAPGTESPYRNRSVEENLDLFARMRAGEFEDGSKVLRAKIDMASPNIHMRDPVIYRIRHTSHHRSGDKWCIYPMYDFAHPLEDAIEHITHSICTLEFEIHRPFYDWLLESLVPAPRPQQIEFARLNLTNTVMSKRKLLELVKEHNVSGWDDPRMPTISGLRRRGVPPEAIRAFCEGIGVTKYNSLTDLSLLEYYIRENLNKTAKRVMVVMNPLKVILDNYPDDLVEEMDAVNNPENPEDGTRKVPFSKVLYIERDDFREEAPKKFYRLAPGAEVRLRYAYFVKCVSVDRDGNGEITAVHCSLGFRETRLQYGSQIV